MEDIGVRLIDLLIGHLLLFSGSTLDLKQDLPYLPEVSS